ncbi:MAG: tetratricopeptide repeat protein [Armatimonas sp.]
MKITLLAAALLLVPLAAHAGLTGQPKPDAATERDIRQAVEGVTGGDVAAARGDLLLALEKAPASDLTDLLEPALLDTQSYTGSATVVQEALAKAPQGDRNFLLYNLARIHLLRARKIQATYRTAPLNAASKVAAQFEPKFSDSALWELAGDIEAERGEPEKAVPYYERMAQNGGSRALAKYRIGSAYARRFLYDKAEKAYLEGVKADAGTGKKLRHWLYQGLASTYLQMGRDKDAGEALVQSGRVTQDDEQPYRLRTDIARQFINRGQYKPAGDYLRMVIKFQPDDGTAKTLLNAASAGRPVR